MNVKKYTKPELEYIKTIEKFKKFYLMKTFFIFMDIEFYNQEKSLEFKKKQKKSKKHPKKMIIFDLILNIEKKKIKKTSKNC